MLPAGEVSAMSEGQQQVQRRRLRIWIGAPALVALTLCAVAMIMQDSKQWQGVELLGDGIDEYLGDLYGKGARAGSFGLLSEQREANKPHGISTSMFTRGLGLSGSSVPSSLGFSDDVGSAPTTIDSLKQEEDLDAAAERVSRDDRRPCAGKPCFDVINGLHVKHGQHKEKQGGRRKT